MELVDRDSGRNFFKVQNSKGEKFGSGHCKVDLNKSADFEVGDEVLKKGDREFLLGSPVSVDLNRKMSKIEKALGPKNMGN